MCKKTVLIKNKKVYFNINLKLFIPDTRPSSSTTLKKNVMTKTIIIYVRLVVISNTRGLYVYTNCKLHCIYLTIISVRTDELTVRSSDRYDSFNKLGKKLFT